MSKRRLGHSTNDSVDPGGDSKSDSLQRVEIITGVGRRRRFSQETKARIVLESLAPGAVVSEVARQHGLTPQQLFGWRRELRGVIAGSDVRTATTGFAPVVVEGSSAASSHLAVAPGRGLIEITIGEVLIRLREGAAPRTIAAVLQAVRATA